MKANKFMIAALMVSAIAFTACKDKNNDEVVDTNSTEQKDDSGKTDDTVNPSDMPTVDAVAGKGVVVLNVPEGNFYCNGIAMRGEYIAGESWDKYFDFVAIEGYENWYKAEVTIGEGGVISEGETVAFGGHPCLKDANGVPAWDFEWVKEDGDDVTAPQILSVDPEGKIRYVGGNLNFDEAGVVYVKVGGWKGTPCVDPDFYDVKVTVNTPAIPADKDVYLTGQFDQWGGGSVKLTPNAERTVWTGTLEQVELNKEFKATLGSWDEDSMTFDEENQCWKGAANAVVDDLEVEFTVANFKSLVKAAGEVICGEKDEDEE